MVSIGGEDWAISIVFLSSLIASYLAFSYLDLGYAGVQIWALLGIYRNQGEGKSSPNTPSEQLATFALLSSGLVLLSYLSGVAYFLGTRRMSQYSPNSREANLKTYVSLQ